MTWVECLAVAGTTALLVWQSRPRRAVMPSLGGRVQFLVQSPAVTLLHAALTGELDRARQVGDDGQIRHLRWLLEEALPTLLAQAALNNWLPESAAFEAALADVWLLGLTPPSTRSGLYRAARRRVRSQGAALGAATWGTWVA